MVNELNELQVNNEVLVRFFYSEKIVNKDFCLIKKIQIFLIFQ